MIGLNELEKAPHESGPGWGQSKVAFSSTARSTQRPDRSGGVLLVCVVKLFGYSVGEVAVCGRRERLSGGVTSHAYRRTAKGARVLRPGQTEPYTRLFYIYNNNVSY